MSVLAGGLTASVLWTDFGLPFIVCWFGAILVVFIWRFLLLAAYAREPERVTPAIWCRRYTMNVIAHGCIWGALAWPLAGYPDFVVHAFVIGVAVGMMAASALTHGAHIPAIKGFVWPVALPLAAASLISLDRHNIVTGILILIYAWLVTSLARRAHVLVVETLLAKYEREGLAWQLSAANHQLALSNGELADANGRLRRAYEAVNEASLAKSKFLANMSHELRTPLNAIIGFSEIMESQLLGPIGEPRYREYAKDIHESGAHLLTVINDILDLSKIEAGELKLQEGLVDPVDVLGRCLRLVAHGAEKGRIALASRFEEGVPLLFADEGRVRQIGFNLISNAIKFTPQGGRVEVSLGGAADGGIVIEIADTGIGMRQEDIPIALQSFRQIDSELTRSQQGTGLGLPLSKTLVELHGGTLEIASELGLGTVVRVSFPGWRARSHPLYPERRAVGG